MWTAGGQHPHLIGRMAACLYTNDYTDKKAPLEPADGVFAWIS